MATLNPEIEMKYWSDICECLTPDTLAAVILDLHPDGIYKEQRAQAWRALVEQVNYDLATVLVNKLNDERNNPKD